MAKKRILIVDDEPDVTFLIKLTLDRFEEFDVRAENSPTHALLAASEFHPDLLLLDMMMPSLDGGDIASLISNDPELKGMPIVFLTATVLKEEVDAHHGIIGGRCFLAKPFEAKALMECVRRALAAAYPPADIGASTAIGAAADYPGDVL